jgi:Xaa-Pro aminopeptidase
MRKDVDKILTENDIGSMLLYVDKPPDLNLYYLSRFVPLGPAVYLKNVNQDPLMIVIPSEVQRAQKESLVKNVHSFFDYECISLVKSASDQRLGLIKFVAAVAKTELDAKKFIYVPPNLPVIVADILRHEGLKATPQLDVLEKARETKEPDETETIQTVQRTAEKAMTEAIETIKNSETGSNKTLQYSEDGKKKTLTVGKIRSVISQVFNEESVVAEEGETQIASGLRSADSDYDGETQDVLKAGEPIVLDLFPKSARKLYHTDTARTIVKDKAPKQIKHMFETVVQTKDAMVDALKAGVSTVDIENLCFDLLEKAGYETMRDGKQITKGLLHAVGHGVGLDSNERPAISGFNKYHLKEHNIVTSELGLYDPDVGGVRIEDILEITKTDCRNMTSMKTLLEI